MTSPRILQSLMAHVLVVDDDPLLTSVLQRGLHHEGFTVQVAHSGDEGLRLAQTAPPDLIILDIMLPGLSGLTLLQRLRTGGDGVPILLLTARDTPTDEVHGLEQGADDYITKPFTFEVLLARIRALLRRRLPEPVNLLRFTDLTLDTGTRRAGRGDRVIDLTATEYDLLHQFLLHPRQVLTRDTLMERVWGYDFGGHTNVLDTYIKQLRQKLEGQSQPRLIHTVHGVGYVLREP